MQANKKSSAGRLMLLFVLIALGTTLFFWQLAGRPKKWFQWGQPDALTQVLQLIQERYVDSLAADSLVGLSLDSLVARLDPHSTYLNPLELQKANEDLSDRFAGIGIGYGWLRDTLTVSFVYAGSPSEAAGLKVGDQLLAIGTTSLLGFQKYPDTVLRLIRGPIGSIASLTVSSQGKIRPLTIRRAAIATPAVTHAHLIDDSIGYIKLIKFSTGSYRECVSALDSLIKKGMRSLILDLRSNGGGFLQEAIDLADEFLADDRLIVYTEGAHLQKRSYLCKRPGLFEEGKLTVLINESSASASEVLAGALQDWCRAKIVGRRSFGKGLVQEQFELSNDAALRLTVARYYTPLGRCIQRPYPSSFLPFGSDGQLNNADNLPSQMKKYRSPCGDTLIGGGGIRPDLEILNEEVQSDNPAVFHFLNSPDFIIWSYRYFTQYNVRIDSFKDPAQWARLQPDNQMKRYFLQEAIPDSISLRPSDWSRIQLEVYLQGIRLQRSEAEFFRLQQLKDPFVLSAIQLLKSH
ncbi:MAG: S41 family peptidase [Bacteroidetes bacterium]|nr:S41 family peptidase [Bacteroidota bacterium]